MVQPKTEKVSKEIYKASQQMKEKKEFQKAGTIAVKALTLSNKNSKWQRGNLKRNSVET